MPPEPPEITELLKAWGSGDAAALGQLTPLVYDELRRLARRYMRNERAGNTLQTTALVNEAYLKLVDQSRAQLNDRAHFLATAALAMRHILVDRAKARFSRKRGGNQFRVTLDDNIVGIQDAPDAVLQINDGLDRLAVIDARLSRIVEYRFFGGLTNAEIGTVLGITERTVERDWIKARMLLREILAS